MSNNAKCSCGKISLTYQGEIKKTSMCHCFECQKRTGSVFGVQTAVDSTKTELKGTPKEYIRIGDDGNKILFYFCQNCGSTLYWKINAKGYENKYIVPVGAFENPALPAPVFSVYKARKHHWVELPNSIEQDWD